MPRVPMPEGPQFQPGGNAPQGRLAAPEASDIGQRQVMALGGAMQEFGASVGGIARDMQAQADELRITDALNQYKERALTLQHDKDAGYLRVRGKDTFDRPDGKSLTEFYGGQLANAAGDIAGTLGNDRQRAAFMKHASNILTTFRGGVQEHEAKEYQTYQLSVSDGVVSTALRDVSLNWNNPDAVDAAIERIRSEVYRQASLTGKSAEWQEARARELASKAHKVGLLAALDANDAGYASQYLKKYSGQLEADDILSVKGQITKAYNAQLGVAVAADHAARATVQMEPTDLDRVFGITVQTESAGNPNAVSPVGARGLMQVMPDTAKRPGFGIKPSDGSQADDVRVGRELLTAHIKTYGGDLGKAWAAYNAGPKWVDAAVARAGNAQAGTPQADWFWQLNNDQRSPANRRQTQDYVTKNLAAYNSGAGAPPRPTFEQVDAGLRADPRLAGNPEAYKLARQEAERRFKETSAAIQQRGDEAVAESMRQIMASGGRFTELPPALRSAIPPDKVSGVMDFAAKWARGEGTTSPLLYQRLTENPQALKGLSEPQFFALRAELSEADFKHFSNERAKLLGKTTTASPGDLNTGAINSALNDRLRQLKLDPTPKDGSDEAAQLGTVRKFVNDYFTRAQQEAGKKFSDAEVIQHLDALFAKNVRFRNTFAGFDTSAQTKPLLGMNLGDIPGADRDRIKQALQRQGVDAPADSMILETYWRSKFTKVPTQASRSAAGGAVVSGVVN
jgi:soluble lytic murein transglycosylase